MLLKWSVRPRVRADYTAGLCELIDNQMDRFVVATHRPNDSCSAVANASMLYNSVPTFSDVQWAYKRWWWTYRVSQKTAAYCFSTNCATVCANKVCFVRFECDTRSIAQTVQYFRLPWL